MRKRTILLVHLVGLFCAARLEGSGREHLERTDLPILEVSEMPDWESEFALIEGASGIVPVAAVT